MHLTCCISSQRGPLRSLQIQSFLDVLASFIQSQSSNGRDIAVQCLESLLARRDYREDVWQTPSIVSGFVDILRRHPGPQMSYQAAFCIWLLTFEKNIAEKINK